MRNAFEVFTYLVAGTCFALLVTALFRAIVMGGVG